MKKNDLYNAFKKDFRKILIARLQEPKVKDISIISTQLQSIHLNELISQDQINELLSLLEQLNASLLKERDFIESAADENYSQAKFQEFLLKNQILTDGTQSSIKIILDMLAREVHPEYPDIVDNIVLGITLKHTPSTCGNFSLLRQEPVP